MPVVKTLKSARPTVDSATNKVRSWDVEVTFTDGDFSHEYSYMKNVTDLNKGVTEFTRDELLGFAPAALDEVFAEHQRVASPDYVPPTVTEVVEFDASGRAHVVPPEGSIVIKPKPSEVITGQGVPPAPAPAPQKKK